jgi:chromosome segregation ATPase
MSASQAGKHGIPAEAVTDDTNLVPVPDVVDVEQPRDAALERLDALQEQVTAGHAALQGRLGAVEPRTSKLEERLKALGSKATSLTSLLRKLTERADASDARLDALEPRNEALEHAADALLAHVEDLDQRHSETTQRVRTLAETTSVLDSRLQETDMRLVERIRQQEGRLDVVHSAHEALSSDHGRLTKRTLHLETLTERLGDQFKRASWIAGGVAAVLAAIAVGGYFYGPSSEPAIALRMDQGLTSLQSAVAGHDQALQANQGTLGDLKDQIAALQAQLDAQAVDPAELQRTYDALVLEVEGVDGRLRAMDSQLADELRAIKERIYDTDDLTGAPVDLATLPSATWLAAQNPDHYVIQLAGSYRQRDLANFIARYGKVLPVDQLSHFQTVYRGRDWFVLLLGSYAKFDQAMAALESLPEAVQRNSPYIRTFGGVQRRL